jgi:hypothetical protein
VVNEGVYTCDHLGRLRTKRRKSWGLVKGGQWPSLAAFHNFQAFHATRPHNRANDTLTQHRNLSMRSGITRLRSYLVLLVLWAGYFHPLLLHPVQTLYAPYSDLLAEHLPAKLFLNREWNASGKLPLWNPHHFCGAPFIHDIQVGIFYPPNAVALLVPESAVWAALSWMIALHVLAAGVFAYIYARSHGLNEAGGLVAACGFMLSSKWMTHLLLAGHTITIGLAWLPLVLLAIERGIADRNAWAVLGAGVSLALLGLGTHPQWAFYAGVFALAWTFPAERRHFARWAACWAGAVVVAVLLSAVQLLPTWEAAQWSARSGELEASGSVSIGLRTAIALLGPSLSYTPPHTWETQGVIGVFWLTAAVAAPLCAQVRTRWRFGVLCGLVVFALGGAAFFEWLPGFSLFRVPTRMLLVAAFPLAFLAGVTTDAATRSEWSLESRTAIARGFRRVALFVGIPTIVGLWFASGETWWAFIAYWVAVVVALVPFIRILQTQTSARTRTILWLAVLLVDLLAPIAILPAVKPQTELYPSSPAMEYLRAQPQPVRVLDWDIGGDDGRASFLGIGAPQAMVHGVSTPRGYNPLDVRHYREFLAFVVDDPQPVRGNSPYTQQVMPNFEVGNPELFRLLAVTHRVAPDNAPTLPGIWKPRLVDPNPPAPPPLMPASPNPLPPHTLTEAANPRPRVWIVPHAERLVSDHLSTLKRCNFSTTVLLASSDELPESIGEKPGTARIAEYRPNRVVMELDGTAGWLVLSDVWFPGWTCRVDGSEVPVYHANHAFRAVPVPAGAKQADFTFSPRSYRVGWWLSVCAVAALAVACATGLLLHFRRRKPNSQA